MQIHELARDIHETTNLLPLPEHESTEAAAVLDSCGPHAYELQHGSFSETEHGRVVFGVAPTPLLDVTGKQHERVDHLTIRYITREGFNVKVGSLFRIVGMSASTGVVEFGDGVLPLPREFLKPEDRRWGTIVGAVRDAVEECRARRETTSATDLQRSVA